MEDGQINVKVSGQSVYNAVKNYLNNNEQLKKAIDEQVQGLVNSGFLETQVNKFVTNELNGYRMRNLLDTTLKNVVTAHVKEKVEEEVKLAVSKALSEGRAVFLNPVGK